MKNLKLTKTPIVKAGMLITAVAQALDSAGGFTTVLDGAKAWLEYNINLNLIGDKFPKGLTEH